MTNNNSNNATETSNRRNIMLVESDNWDCEVDPSGGFEEDGADREDTSEMDEWVK